MKIDLEECVLNKMQISHIYNPATLKVLFDKYGLASLKEIAASLLTYDVYQVEYDELRAEHMVGEGLTQ